MINRLDGPSPTATIDRGTEARCRGRECTNNVPIPLFAISTSLMVR